MLKENGQNQAKPYDFRNSEGSICTIPSELSF